MRKLPVWLHIMRRKVVFEFFFFFFGLEKNKCIKIEKHGKDEKSSP